MKVLNIHQRVIQQPKSVLEKLFRTLSSKNDMMLATDRWSPMRLDNGLQVGSKGGHGPIKYTVVDYLPDNSITFRFDLKGFDGYHKFVLTALDSNKTELKHIIDMNTSGAATFKWALAIRWLHDAYIEDAFDKVENHFFATKKQSKWSLWVRILREIMKPKRK